LDSELGDKMEIKLIQINVQHFQLAKELLRFLMEQGLCIINMQEVSTGLQNANNDKDSDFFEIFTKKLGMYSVRGDQWVIVHTSDGKKHSRACGVLSSYPILDWTILRGDVLGKFVEISSNHPLFTVSTPKEKYDIYKQLPRNIVSCLVDVGGKIIRVMTSHFVASQRCMEVEEMFNHAAYICEYLEATKSIPTIFSADMNIEKDSRSVRCISDSLKYVDLDGQNTLNRRIHGGFKRDIPHKGYGVDHVFYKDLELRGAKIMDVDVSDHLPIVVFFKI